MISWRGGVLHSDDVRQMPEKAFGELSHLVVMHEPVISNNHDVNINLVYIIINRTNQSDSPQKMNFQEQNSSS